jgi:hypothetical protein
MLKPRKTVRVKCKFCPTLVDVTTGPRLGTELVCHACFGALTRRRPAAEDAGAQAPGEGAADD